MVPLPAAMDTDTDSDDPSSNVTVYTTPPASDTNEPDDTLPPDTMKSDSDTPDTALPNVAVNVTDDDDVVEPDNKPSPLLNVTDGAYVNATWLDAALLGVMPPLAADTLTSTVPADPNDTSIVYTEPLPPTGTRLLTTHPTQLMSDADTPLTSVPNVAVNTSDVALVTSPTPTSDVVNTNDGV